MQSELILNEFILFFPLHFHLHSSQLFTKLIMLFHSQRCSLGRQISWYNGILWGLRLLPSYFYFAICFANPWSRIGKEYKNSCSLFRINIYFNGHIQVNINIFNSSSSSHISSFLFLSVFWHVWWVTLYDLSHGLDCSAISVHQWLQLRLLVLQCTWKLILLAST